MKSYSDNVQFSGSDYSFKGSNLFNLLYLILSGSETSTAPESGYPIPALVLTAARQIHFRSAAVRIINFIFRIYGSEGKH